MMKVENRLVSLKDAEIDYLKIQLLCKNRKFLSKKDVTYTRKKVVGFYYPGMIAKYSSFYTYDSIHFVK